MAKRGNVLYTIGYILQGLLYVGAGVNHFLNTDLYVRIMPPHYTNPLFWVQLTGILEVAGGIGLLLSFTRPLAAWGIVLMLLAYFDVHFTMAMHPAWYPEVPAWALYARIPLQLVLIAWAWRYTAAPEPSRNPADQDTLVGDELRIMPAGGRIRQSLRGRREALGAVIHPFRNRRADDTTTVAPRTFRSPFRSSGVHGVRNWRFPRRRSSDYPVTPPPQN